MSRRFRQMLPFIVFFGMPDLGWAIEARFGFPVTKVLARDAIEFVQPRAEHLFRTFSGQ